MDDYYRVVGGLGSPYSMKIRAVFRYRRLPHVFQMRNGSIREETSDVKPSIIPMVRGSFDSSWMVDSTPIIYALEERHSNGRSILPDDEGMRFLAELIEDFADEWLTKAMFHYRWYYATDRDYSAFWIASDQVEGAGSSRSRRRQFARQISDRQVSRMALVGCTDENKPVIEQSYHRVLDALEGHVGFGDFLFGTRPSLADFGLFGQLKTLSDDPTPQWIMRQRAPTVSNWIRQIDDLSGINGEWQNGSDIPEVVRKLLAICGDTYLPFLSANKEAVESEVEQLELDVLGHRFAQPPFRYQLKCYSRLRSLYANLSQHAKDRINTVLQATDCHRWLV